MEVIKYDSKVSWIVAMVCVFLNLFVTIPTKVSGLFFVEILERYQINRNLAAYPAFTITLMRCSGGPFAGYFAERFGINEVMLLGSLLTGLGISACFFAEDIIAVTVFLGLTHGCGVAFTNTFFPQVVKTHFRKHLTLAYGFTQVGACLGSFFSPPLLLWIFRSYGTSGGFLIIGAIVLNGLPLVLILNNLAPNKLYNKSVDSKKSLKRPAEHLEMGVATAINSFESKDNIRANNIGDEKEKDVNARDVNADSEISNNLENKFVAALVPNRPTYDHTEVVPGSSGGLTLNPSSDLTTCRLSMEESGLESETVENQTELVFSESGMMSELKPKNNIQNKKMKVETDEKINEMQYDFKEEPIPAKMMTNDFEKNLPHSNDCTHPKTEYKLKAELNNKYILNYRAGEVKNCYPSKNNGSSTPPYISMSNVSASSYLVDQQKTQQQITIENEKIIPTSFNTLNTRSLESNELSKEKINHEEVLKIDKKPTTGKKNAKKSLTIFLDVTFWMVIITQSIQVFILILFWTTMIDFSRDKSIDRDKEVYMLMILPISEIIGRLGLGWITDKEYLTRINFSILCFILMGFSCSLMAWAQGFIIVMTSIFLFGVISSGLITVFPMIVIEFFDSTKHTMGQASRYMLFGPLSLLSGPLIGYFRGTLGSYAWLYHTIAMVAVACGALSALIPVLARIRDEKKSKIS